MEMAVEASAIPDQGELLRKGFRLGEWTVRPIEGVIESLLGKRHLQPKSMDVLLCLAGSASQIVERDEIIEVVWGQAAVTDEPLTRCIHEIRRALSDTCDNPTYIQTIPKRGYRLIAPVDLAIKIDDSIVRRIRGMFCRRNLDFFAIAMLLAVLTGLLMDLRDDVAPVSLSGETGSIAVLPFATTGAPVDDRWLGMGFARDLLGLLALVENLQVSARSLSASFLAGSSDVLDIGRSLNVHYVLKGDVSLSAGHIDVNVRLIDAQTRFRVWSETYAGNADDVFAIQEDIARQVTAALRLRLPPAFGEQRFAMPGSLPPATSVPTHSFVAWRSFLHGREVLETAETGEALLESVEAFQQAIHEDPEFVNAYAGLCSALVRRYEIGGAESELAFAGQVCQQAVSLDSKSIAAQTALGDLYRVTDRADEAIDAYAGIIRTRPQAVDAYRGVALAYASKGATEKAEKAFRTAISVMPDDSRAYKDYGEFLFQRHRYHEVLEIGRALVVLNPESSAGFRALADASFNNGEFVAAIAAYREVLRRDASPEAFMRIGTSLYYLGRFEEAATMYDLTAKMLPDDHRIWSNIGDTYLQIPNGGDRATYAFAMARVLIEKSADRLPDDPLAGVSLAYYCAAIGDVDCAGSRADEAVALQPDHPGVLYYRALISLRLGNESRAVAAARDALRYGYPRALFEADPRLEKVRASREFSAPLIASNRLRTVPRFSAAFR